MDNRNIKTGHPIPSGNYCDQPYVVITNDNAWLCCLTTSSGSEGATDEFVATMRSVDKGKTWSDPIRVEPDCQLENSYAVMLKVPSGRIYIFYGHNSDNTREILSHDRKTRFTRVDSQGHYVFKFSDDNGISWSTKRYDIPIRSFQCDLNNVYGGKIRFFWNVGKPFIRGNEAFIPLSKVGRMGDGFFAQSEGALLCSSNILTENDPEAIRFETLPEGLCGLRTPPGGGPVSEEHSYVVLSDGAICASYRSIDGYAVETYSRDGGRNWLVPYYKRIANGRLAKQPRAANFMWKCSNGKYLYWFHNHGGHFIRDMWDGQKECCGGMNYYEDRNPVWISAGVETDSPEGRIIRWSDPELLLYDEDPYVRISYPDLIEDDGEYYITETQKITARSHRISKKLLENMWASMEGQWPSPIPDCILSKTGNAPTVAGMTERNDTVCRRLPGFSIKVSFNCQTHATLVNAINENGYGFRIYINERRQLALRMADPWTEQTVTSPTLPENAHSAVIVIDSFPCIISFFADDHFLDGGEERQFGFQRLNPMLRHLNWCRQWILGNICNEIAVFNRPLTGVEAIGCQRAHANCSPN